MNCQETNIKLQELLDGALETAEAKSVKGHLRSCPECRSEYRLLKRTATSLAGLPEFQPSREFNQKVLTALGLELQPRTLTAWAKLAIGSGLFTAATWLAMAVVAAAWLFPTVKMTGYLKYLFKPQELLTIVGMELVKLGYSVGGLLGLAAKGVKLAMHGSNLPLQFGLALAVVIVIVAASNGAVRPLHLKPRK